ncbi:hypothetical protein [Streptomyces sp. NPDC058401]|uniref:hypothetical protein n=1 Tax=Streptomyces sp. NPDC058401 TaxID=3346480 RepID=UPI00364A9E96
MRKVNKWLALHPWVQGVLLAVIGAGVILLLNPGRSPLGALLRAGSGAVGATVMLLLMRRRERRMISAASEEDYVSLDDRLRHGEVPESEEGRAAMGRLVRDRLDRSRHRVWALAFLFLLFASITTLAATTADVRQAVVLALLATAFLTWLTWTGVHQHRLLVRMDGELRGDVDSVRR